MKYITLSLLLLSVVFFVNELERRPNIEEGRSRIQGRKRLSFTKVYLTHDPTIKKAIREHNELLGRQAEEIE